jgi:hypothetical protein
MGHGRSRIALCIGLTIWFFAILLDLLYLLHQAI